MWENRGNQVLGNLHYSNRFGSSTTVKMLRIMLPLKEALDGLAPQRPRYMKEYNATCIIVTGR